MIAGRARRAKVHRFIRARRCVREKAIMELLTFGLVLPWILVALGGWLVFQLLQQSGRILLRLDAIEQRLAALAPPAPPPMSELPIGQPAPEFDLPDLHGQRHTLTEYRGRKMLLVFFSPQCGFCLQMLPELAEWSADGNDERPGLVVVSNGDAGHNRELFEEAGIHHGVLLQNGMEVAAQYRVQATPMGYLIDEQGAIASRRTVGAESLLALGEPAPVSHAGANGTAHEPARAKANVGLAKSRIKRDGLEPGTAAPNFKLPTMAGGELELEQLRGKPVLLVFSDPECGPCEQVAVRLEQLHRQGAGFHVAVVSRRDAELNRRKIETLGLTFPVALQKQWEVSRLYAMFATPVGYWIDAQGVVAAKVAVGLESIVALPEAFVAANGKH
jgi:peroxiredoxin